MSHACWCSTSRRLGPTRNCVRKSGRSWKRFSCNSSAITNQYHLRKGVGSAGSAGILVRIEREGRITMVPEQITVRVLKYDGTEYRRWNARIVRTVDSLIVLEGEFESD